LCCDANHHHHHPLLNATHHSPTTTMVLALLFNYMSIEVLLALSVLLSVSLLARRLWAHKKVLDKDRRDVKHVKQELQQVEQEAHAKQDQDADEQTLIAAQCDASRSSSSE
jgi:mannitol-specific phosphotransferase system IIBC component